MRIPVVRDHDATTTGGRVIALKAMIHDKGIKLALDGEHATCGNCKGLWPMHGTGDKMRNRGMRVVIDNDSVLCPCGKNRVIAGEGAGCFVHVASNSQSAGVAQSPGEVVQVALYDEQFTLLDDSRQPLADMRYRIVVDGKQVITGTTNASGQTERVTTRIASSLKLQLEN